LRLCMRCRHKSALTLSSAVVCRPAAIPSAPLLRQPRRRHPSTPPSRSSRRQEPQRVLASAARSRSYFTLEVPARLSPLGCEERVEGTIAGVADGDANSASPLPPTDHPPAQTASPAHQFPHARVRRSRQPPPAHLAHAPHQTRRQHTAAAPQQHTAASQLGITPLQHTSPACAHPVHCATLARAQSR
jgi:hypothetical protein